MMQGGLFSVTLSVTWDLHPKYPRFHEACRLPVFGLSSGEKLSSQRSPATIGILPSKRSEIQPGPKTAPFALGVMGGGLLLQHGANRYGLLTFRMKLVKYVLISRSDFPGVSGGDSEGKISCAAWEN